MLELNPMLKPPLKKQNSGSAVTISICSFLRLEMWGAPSRPPALNHQSVHSKATRQTKVWELQWKGATFWAVINLLSLQHLLLHTRTYLLSNLQFILITLYIFCLHWPEWRSSRSVGRQLTWRTCAEQDKPACAHAPAWFVLGTDKKSVLADLCVLMGAYYTTRSEMRWEKELHLIVI